MTEHSDALHVAGLHHVTAIAGDPQANYDFYVKTLGLRLVKQTVNFDDPGTYHLYYGDELGRPGSAMTFFPWIGIRKGRIGLGQAALTQFAVPAGALDFWEKRLTDKGVPVVAREEIFGEARLVALDPDGLAFALVEAPDDARPGWTGDGVGEEHAIRGFHGVTLALAEAAPTAEIATTLLGYEQVGEEEAAQGRLLRFRSQGPASVLDIHEAPGMAHGIEGSGAVHHIAFSVPNAGAQAEIRARVAKAGWGVTPPIDRDYFMAIYFRTPGGVLFEVATDDPGFDRDEPRESLGRSLKLPRQHERYRARIEEILPPLKL